MELEEWKKQSKVMFDTADDREYLLCESVRGEIDKAVIQAFLMSKINKTDFQVLNDLMYFKFYEIEESVFIFESLDELILVGLSDLSKPNLSRSLKSLCVNGFIEKVNDYERQTTYKFLTAFKKLEELT